MAIHDRPGRQTGDLYVVCYVKEDKTTVVTWETLFFISLIFLAWIGGNHVGVRQCRSLSSAYQSAVNHNETLRKSREQRDLEFLKLQNRVYQLENELETYKVEISDLSSKIVWLREQLENKNTVS